MFETYVLQGTERDRKDIHFKPIITIIIII